MISNLSKKITTTTTTNNIDGDHNETNNKSNNDDEWNNHHDGQWLAVIVMEWAPANKWHWFLSYSLINPWSTAAQQAKIVNNQRRTSISTITWPTPFIVVMEPTFHYLHDWNHLIWTIATYPALKYQPFPFCKSTMTSPAIVFNHKFSRAPTPRVASQIHAVVQNGRHHHAPGFFLH